MGDGSCHEVVVRQASSGSELRKELTIDHVALEWRLGPKLSELHFSLRGSQAWNLSYDIQ